jgi:acetylornithine deacetylase
MATLSSIDLITRLVAFDTTSRESNLALIDFARDYLDGFGIASELVFDTAGRKANLFATIGPPDGAGIILSGHTDVVPVDGQLWTDDPFEVRERDGRLIGRGVADMKSFIAVAMAKVPDAMTKLRRTPIHLALTFDEEVGCLGVQELMPIVERRHPKPRACVVGEPTLMKPVTGHKGKRSLRCHVHGLECHSAMTHVGVNAVEAAAEMVAYLKSMARRFRDQGPFDGDFDPPYTTVHTGHIEGGTALNIVPKHCLFDFEFRHLPEHDPDAILHEIQAEAGRLTAEMRQVFDQAGFDFQTVSAITGLATSGDEEIVTLVQQLTGGNGTGKVSFGTEGGFYQHAGIPTVICGPGSIDQAHKPDEWIALEQITACEGFLDRLIDRLAAE